MKTFVIIFFAIFPIVSKAQFLDDYKLMTEIYPPFQYMEDGKLKGPVIDILEEMLKRLNSKKTRADFKVFPWARSYKLIQKEPKTALFSMSRTKKREKLFRWVGSLGPLDQVIIGKKSALNKKVNSLDELKKYRIAVIRDDVGEQILLQRGFPKEMIHRANRINQIIGLLDKDRVQFWAYGGPVAKFNLKKAGKNLDDYNVVYTLRTGGNWYAFHKETPDHIIKTLQETLDSMKKDGSHQKIWDSYFK